MAANVIKVRIEQLEKTLAEGEKQIAKAVRRGARRGAERARALIVKKTPTDQGQLRASWKVRATSLAVELLNDAPHASIVELGARPHKVSVEGWIAIYEWVRRHPDLYDATRMRRPVQRTMAQIAEGPRAGLDPEISGITWAIVKKIQKEGQKPTFFVQKNLPEIEAVLVHETEIQIAKAVATFKARG